MPWSQMSPMEQRTQLIADYLRDLLSVTELCELYGVRRKTGYKWLQRAQEQGVEGRGHQDPEREAGAGPKPGTPAAPVKGPGGRGETGGDQQARRQHERRYQFLQQEHGESLRGRRGITTKKRRSHTVLALRPRLSRSYAPPHPRDAIPPASSGAYSVSSGLRKVFLR